MPQTGTAEGIGYEIVIGGGENGEDIVKVTGGTTDPDGTLTIRPEIEIDGVKYPVTEIGDGAFKDRTDIKEVVISNSVEKVGDEAFSGCTNLKKVVEEDGEKPLTFGKDAFKDVPIEEIYQGRDHDGKPYTGNDNLQKIVIGDKVTTIVSGEYSDCPNIEEVESTNHVPPVLAEDAFEEVVFDNAKLTVLDNNKATYKNADGWKKFANVVEKNEIPVISIELNLTALPLTEGESQQLTAIITPENATEQTLTWSSSDVSVATVDANGAVLAIKSGTATITVTCGEFSATCAVTVITKNADTPTAPEQPGEDPGEGDQPGGGNPANPEQSGAGEDEPGEGDDDSAIDYVNGDSEIGVRVEGGSIVAPEGSVVYDLTGRRGAKTNLPKGIYIVRTPAGRTVKVRID